MIGQAILLITWLAFVVLAAWWAVGTLMSLHREARERGERRRTSPQSRRGRSKGPNDLAPWDRL